MGTNMQEKCKLSGIVIFVLLFYIAVAIFIYYPTVESLVHIWVFSEYGTYKHGLLLLGVGIYFSYKSWMRLRSEIAICFDMAGFLLLIMASMIWFFGQIAEIQIAQQLMFIFIIYFIFWAVLGYQISRKFAFPVLLLICATPVWGVISEGWLQSVTAEIVTFLLKLTGVNAYNEDIRIFIPEGTFRVDLGCSGMQQLIAAVSVVAIYAYLNKFRFVSLLVYMALAAVLSFILNIIRIFIVVISGHLTDMQHYFVQVDHVSLGWVLFGIGMFIFILFSNRFLLSQYGSLVMKTDNNKEGVKLDSVGLNKKCVFQIFLVMLGLSVGPLLAQIQDSKIQEEIGELSVPATFKRWQLSDTQKYDYRPFYIPADRVFEGNYTTGSGGEVYCYIGYYQDQKQDKELISHLNSIHDNKTWIRLVSRQYNIVVSNLDFMVKESIVKTPQGREKLIWHWYYLAGIQTSNEKIAKLLEIWSELSEQPGASLFLVATDVDESYAGSRKKLHDFLSDSLAGLEMAVEQIGEPN